MYDPENLQKPQSVHDLTKQQSVRTAFAINGSAFLELNEVNQL